MLLKLGESTAIEPARIVAVEVEVNVFDDDEEFPYCISVQTADGTHFQVEYFETEDDAIKYFARLVERINDAKSATEN